MEIFAWIGIFWAVLVFFRIVLERMEHDEKMERFREQADRTIRIVKLEQLKEHNTILAYDAENNQFLGQADSVPDVKNVIMERFPTKVFLLNDKAFSKLHANVEVQLEKSITS
jgi:hypothetical protein